MYHDPAKVSYSKLEAKKASVAINLAQDFEQGQTDTQNPAFMQACHDSLIVR
jgi:hypothetical protein